jgi:hypothetical protein
MRHDTRRKVEGNFRDSQLGAGPRVADASYVRRLAAALRVEWARVDDNCQDYGAVVARRLRALQDNRRAPELEITTIC